MPAIDLAKRKQLIDMAAKATGLDPRIINRIGEVESGWRSGQTSPAGATGLFQLMPGTAKDMGVKDINDDAQNVLGGARYFKKMLDEFGDIPTAAAVYNAGPGNVRKFGGIPPFPETQNYVKKFQDLVPKPSTTGGDMGGSGENNIFKRAINFGKQQSPIYQLLSSLGIDPQEEAKKQKRASIFDAAMGGLAQVAASFNPRRGAELQQDMAQQAATRQKAYQGNPMQDAMTAIGAYSKLIPENKVTNDITNYEYSKKNNQFQGTLPEFMKTTRIPLMNQMDSLIYPVLKDELTDYEKRKKNRFSLQPQASPQPQSNIVDLNDAFK